MDNWDIFIFGAGMVGLVIWALYFTSTVVDELRELNRQAGIIASGVQNNWNTLDNIENLNRTLYNSAAYTSTATVDSRQELKEIKQLLQQLIRDR